MPKTSGFWFIRDGSKLIQCNKEAFDKAIVEGKSVKYGGYANKRCERLAEKLEEARMAYLADPSLSQKFRAVITDPRNVCEVQIIQVNDPEFWAKEARRPKYQQ